MSAGAWRWAALSIASVKRSGNRLLCPASPSFWGREGPPSASSWLPWAGFALVCKLLAQNLLSTSTFYKARPPLKGLPCTCQPSLEISEPCQQRLAMLGHAAALSLLGSFPSHPKTPT